MDQTRQDAQRGEGFIFPGEWLMFGPVGLPQAEQAELDDALADPIQARERLARVCGEPQRVTFDARHALDLNADTAHTTVYLLAEVTLDQDREITVGACSAGELRVLVGSECVYHLPPAPGMAWRHRAASSILDHSFAMRLHAGTNRIAVKVRRCEQTGQFDLALGGPEEVEALKQERRARAADILDKRDVAPPGEIAYVNPDPPDVPLKPYIGTRYRDRVPDTYDVAERAALCLNALTGATNPLADHELYFWALFFRNPVVMAHEISDVCQTKFMEALPLLRIASGSQVRLEVDEVWRQVTLKSIGPDGLFYVPLAGRPWGREPAAWVPRVARADGTVVPSSDPTVTQFSYAVVCGRMMNAMIAHHLREGHPFWGDTIRKMIARLSELSVDQGDYCFLPPMALEPNARYDKEAMAAERPGPTLPEGEFFVRLLEGLGMFYRLTGHDGARELGGKLVRFIREQWTYFAANGEFLNGGMHFHGHAMVLLNLLEMATATDDRETMEFVRKSYEWARTPAAGSCDTIGFFPEVAHPAFGTCEACEIADMIGLALKLSRAGVGDYYNDAERWTRNHFAESQLLEEQVPLVYYLSGAQPPTPVGEHETAWRAPERNVGAFAGWSTANEWAVVDTRGIMHCCTGNAARTLYWIWQEALRFKDGELCVNLLLNRASREADVYSFIPYQGRVEIKVKEPCEAVYIHAPGWVETGSPEMLATVDGKGAETRWEGRYLVLGPVQPGRRVTVTFPIAERTVTETIGAVEYALVIKGDTVVHIDPPGRNLPLYRREHYRSSEPRYIEVERFLSDDNVDY